MILLLTCKSEGIIAAYITFFIFFIPGIIFLISNRKTVRILGNKVIYHPVIGKKKELAGSKDAGGRCHFHRGLLWDKRNLPGDGMPGRADTGAEPACRDGDICRAGE